MLKSKSLTLLGIISLACFSAPVLADAAFKVPVNYTIELVDGDTSHYNYDRFNRSIKFGPGRHQVVVKFKGNFGSNSEGRMVEAPSPLVIDIYNIRDNQTYSFTYPIPRDEDNAYRYARAQKIELVNHDTGSSLSPEEATYFILASEAGISFIRDYRSELLALNRLYAPTYVADGQRQIGMTAYGAPTITASGQSNVFSGIGNNVERPRTAMSAPATSYSQQSNMQTSRTDGTQVRGGGAGLQQLIQLYEQADDTTKLQFVKYVMSH